MNLQSWVLLIIIIICLAAAIIHIARNKGCSCGGNCAGCSKCCSPEEKEKRFL